MAEAKLVLALINLILGAGISVVAFCRLTECPTGLSVIKIAPYALMMSGGLASAFQPWMGHWPTPNQVFFSAAFFVYVLSTRPRTCEGP